MVSRLLENVIEMRKLGNDVTNQNKGIPTLCTELFQFTYLSLIQRFLELCMHHHQGLFDVFSHVQHMLINGSSHFFFSIPFDMSSVYFLGV